jgi:flagellar biogenesis protein FliO
MPTEAWTAAAAKPDANTLPQQMTAVGNGDPYNSSSPSGTESSVQFAGYTATQDEPAPSVYSAGANQRVGSVATVPNAPQPSAAPPKERQRIPIADKTGNAEGGTKSSSTIRPLLSMVFSLLIVLGLFFGMVWLYRKSSNNPSQAVPKQVVQILGRTPMAARQHLVLVRFGSKLLLVSLAQGETRTLGEITDPLEVDQLAGLCESSSPNSLSNSFRNILSQGVQA